MPGETRPKLCLSVTVLGVKGRSRKLEKYQVRLVLQLKGEVQLTTLVDGERAAKSDSRQSDWHIQVVESLVQLAEPDNLQWRQKGQNEVVDTRLGYVEGQVQPLSINANV